MLIQVVNLQQFWKNPRFAIIKLSIKIYLVTKKISSREIVKILPSAEKYSKICTAKVHPRVNKSKRKLISLRYYE